MRANKRTPARRYTEQEIDQGLFALAWMSGNSRRAASLLATQQVHIPASTLADWTKRYPDRYARVRVETLPRLNADLAEQHTALAQAGMDLEDELRRKIVEQQAEIPARDLPGALRNVATSTGIHSDKARILRGEPTQIVEHKDPLALLRSLRSKGVEVVIEHDVEVLPE
jgi:hypothetical protein